MKCQHNNLMNCIGKKPTFGKPVRTVCMCWWGGGRTSHSWGQQPSERVLPIYIFWNFLRDPYGIIEYLVSVCVWKGGVGAMRVGNTTTIPIFIFFSLPT